MEQQLLKLIDKPILSMFDSTRSNLIKELDKELDKIKLQLVEVVEVFSTNLDQSEPTELRKIQTKLMSKMAEETTQIESQVIHCDHLNDQINDNPKEEFDCNNIKHLRKALFKAWETNNKQREYMVRSFSHRKQLLEQNNQLITDLTVERRENRELKAKLKVKEELIRLLIEMMQQKPMQQNSTVIELMSR